MEIQHRKKFLGISVGVTFAFVFLFAVEYLLNKISGYSFFTLLKSGNSMPLIVFICGCIIGMACEYLGQFSFKWWYYPSVNHDKTLLIGLPIFWGIFMIIMQDMYTIFRIFSFHQILAVVISTFITGCLIEGVNLYTRSWVYRKWGASPFALLPGWIILLSFVFVIGFNAYIINPFGF